MKINRFLPARILNYFNLQPDIILTMSDTKWKNHLKREANVNFATKISAIVLFASFCSFAGIDLRIGGGLNLSDEIHSGDFKLSDAYKKKLHVGFNAGASMAIYFTQQLGIFTGLSYESRGSYWKVEDAETGSSRSADYSMWYLQIPVLFSYKPIPALAIDLGPELGIFLAGKGKEWGNTRDLNEIKPVDLGASLTVDYTIANMIAVGAGYYYGFLHNVKGPKADYVKGSISNSNIKLFVAYVYHWKE
jgi:hypothetical protein